MSQIGLGLRLPGAVLAIVASRANIRTTEPVTLDRDGGTDAPRYCHRLPRRGPRRLLPHVHHFFDQRGDGLDQFLLAHILHLEGDGLRIGRDTEGNEGRPQGGHRARELGQAARVPMHPGRHPDAG